MGAIQYLLKRQRSRDNLEMLSWLAAYVGCLGVGLFSAWLFGRPPLVVMISYLSALAILPGMRGLYDASVLHGFLLGGAYAEIRQTRLAHREIVDALVVEGLKFQSLWAIFPTALLAVAVGPMKALGWAAALLGITIFASYSFLAQVSGRYTGSSGSLRPALPMLLTVVLSSVVKAEYLIPSVVASLLFLVREAAITTLGQAEMCSAVERLRVTRKMVWLPWSENPVVARECARESNFLGGNWATVAWHFFGWGLVATVVLLGCRVYTPAVFESGSMFETVLAFGLVQAARAGFRVSRALADERDRRTVDVLLLTGLGPREFVTGWAQVGYQIRQLETFWVVVAVLFLQCFTAPPLDFIARVACAGMLSVLFCAAGSYAGLLIGFRVCLKTRGWRDAVLPIALAGWFVLTYPLLEQPWTYFLVQGLAVWAFLRWTRNKCRQALGAAD